MEVDTAMAANIQERVRMQSGNPVRRIGRLTNYRASKTAGPAAGLSQGFPRASCSCS